jgi:Holliday junction resolvase RusA-like endonuclease
VYQLLSKYIFSQRIPSNSDLNCNSVKFEFCKLGFHHNNNLSTANMGDVIEIADSSDEEEDVTQEYRLCLLGHPVPMPRPRVFNNRFINPRKPEMEDFKRRVIEKIPQAANGPLFGRRVPVQLTIWFLLKRPDDDFVNNNRVLGRLKAAAKNLLFVPITPDIDNLAKFVLDSLIGVGYADDAQVVKLEVYKLRDSIGSCNGATIFHLERFNNNAGTMLPENYMQWI